MASTNPGGSRIEWAALKWHIRVQGEILWARALAIWNWILGRYANEDFTDDTVRVLVHGQQRGNPYILTDAEKAADYCARILLETAEPRDENRELDRPEGAGQPITMLNRNAFYFSVGPRCRARRDIENIHDLDRRIEAAIYNRLGKWIRDGDVLGPWVRQHGQTLETLRKMQDEELESWLTDMLALHVSIDFPSESRAWRIHGLSRPFDRVVCVHRSSNGPYFERAYRHNGRGEQPPVFQIGSATISPHTSRHARVNMHTRRAHSPVTMWILSNMRDMVLTLGTHPANDLVVDSPDHDDLPRATIRVRISETAILGENNEALSVHGLVQVTHASTPIFAEQTDRSARIHFVKRISNATAIPSRVGSDDGAAQGRSQIVPRSGREEAATQDMPIPGRSLEEARAAGGEERTPLAAIILQPVAYTKYGGNYFRPSVRPRARVLPREGESPCYGGVAQGLGVGDIAVNGFATAIELFPAVALAARPVDGETGGPDWQIAAIVRADDRELVVYDPNQAELTPAMLPNTGLKVYVLETGCRLHLGEWEARWLDASTARLPASIFHGGLFSDDPRRGYVPVEVDTPAELAFTRDPAYPVASACPIADGYLSSRPANVGLSFPNEYGRVAIVLPYDRERWDPDRPFPAHPLLFARVGGAEGTWNVWHPDEKIKVAACEPLTFDRTVSYDGRDCHGARIDRRFELIVGSALYDVMPRGT